MRLLWLHQYFSTPKGWGAVRTYEFARRFVAKGHAVDVVCCGGYDAWLQAAAAEGGSVEVEGIRVFVSPVKYGNRMSFWQRIGSFLGFMSYALGFVLRHGRRYDLCIVSSGPLTLAVPALLGRLVHRLPYVFEVIDVWPDSAIHAGVLKSRFLKGLSFFLERKAYQHAAAIVTCSTGMTDRIVNKLLRKSDVTPEHRSEGDDFSLQQVVTGNKTYKLQTISNSCDVEQLEPCADVRRAVRDEQGVAEEQLVVLYSGAMGVSNGIDDVIAAIHATEGDARIVWWLAGAGVRADDLKAMEAPRRVHFFGQLSKEEVVRLYQSADVNLVTFMHTPLFYENSPNKFFDGIAAGLPAVFNRTTWLEPWISAYGCGVVCDGGDPGAAIAQELGRLAGDRQRLCAMSVGARRLAVEVFGREKAAENYEVIVTTQWSQ